MGSLLSAPPVAIPYGHFVIRNFFLFDGHKGVYQSNWKSSSREDSYYSFRYELQSFFGLNDFFDLSLSTQCYFNTKGRYAYSNIGDIIAGLDFQLLDDERFSFFPGIKFSVTEVFPTGHYQLFTPKKGYMEKTGSGTYSTQFTLFIYKQYPLSPNWKFSTAFEGQYQVNSPVSVKGFHSYGGGFGTNGKLLVGNAWKCLTNSQIFYKEAISLSLDLLYEHYDTSHFYGTPGINFYGRYSNTSQPSSERFSLAPSFSYIFPSQVGIMAGCWLSLCGRNAEQFSQYASNIFYIF